jgi:hypothetical protein
VGTAGAAVCVVDGRPNVGFDGWQDAEDPFGAGVEIEPIQAPIISIWMKITQFGTVAGFWPIHTRITDGCSRESDRPGRRRCSRPPGR